MALNLLDTDEACHGCIKRYACKHNLKTGDSFEISCRGIPKDYINGAVAEHADILSAQMVMDPVIWAREVLDWHCLDPESEVWKRKEPKEYADAMEEYPGRTSKYHRPYQAEMLRCTSKRKIFRIGRQAGKTETLVISMLFNMFTNSNFKIVLITPFQSQVELIFKRLETLITQSRLVQNSIARSVKAPNYSIELHNGSSIKGFTAGTKSGSGAASARGQSANMIVFDEADYLSGADLEAAMAITINFPDATVWMSSTPTGKRDKFFDNCHSKKWREYHFPSYVNPNWNIDMETQFKEEYTEIGYKHEVLADFGEQEDGVFQTQYVERAQIDYEYKDMNPTSQWFYAIGVDWNSPAIGTTICVVGFNPQLNKMYIVERQVIQRAGWTQLAACMALRDLNRKWRPFVIYVDAGYGSTQVEVLRKEGFDAILDPERGAKHIDARLRHIVKPYDFGSKVEISDPWHQGQKTKKHAKTFLVENAVRRFEQNEIFYSEKDADLTKELLAYIISNISVTGQYIYGTNSEAIGDHNLDAFMLALVGFTLEMSAFGKRIDRSNGFHFTPMANSDGMVAGDAPARKDVYKHANPSHEQGRADMNKPQPTRKVKPWTEPEEKRKLPIVNNKELPRTRSSGLFNTRRSGIMPIRKNIR